MVALREEDLMYLYRKSINGLGEAHGRSQYPSHLRDPIDPNIAAGWRVRLTPSSRPSSPDWGMSGSLWGYSMAATPTQQRSWLWPKLRITRPIQPTPTFTTITIIVQRGSKSHSGTAQQGPTGGAYAATARK